MYKLSNIDISRFYFNGHYSTDFEIDVAGDSGFQTYSLAPQIISKTETIDGRDGEFEVSSQYAPRTFILPVLVNNQDRIREISSWIASKTEKRFFFGNDRIQLNAKLDDVIDINYYMQGGLSEFKFKATNPYFEEINKTKYIITKSGTTIYDYNNTKSLVQNNTIDYVNFNDNTINITTSALDNVRVYNDGTVNSKPLIKLYGDGDITVTWNGNNFIIQGVTSYVEVDFKNFEVYKDASNALSSFQTTFPVTIQHFDMIPQWNTFACSSNVTKIEISPRSRWI